MTGGGRAYLAHCRQALNQLLEAERELTGRQASPAGILRSEDLLGVATLARAGAGLLQTYRFIVEEDLQRGSLVELLQPFAGCSRPFSLIYPGNRHMLLRVRVFIDYVLEALGAPENSSRQNSARSTPRPS